MPALDPFDESRIFAINNGADIRTAFSGDRNDVSDVPPGELRPIGSRPIANDYDDIYTFQRGGEEEFFGWPDYYHDPDSGQVLPVTDPLFCRDELLLPDCSHDFLLEEDFRQGLEVRSAFAQLEQHSSANKFDFSPSKRFGDVGDLFVAETGSFVPVTGAERFTGYKVVRVDRETGQTHDFISNVGDELDEVFDPDSFNKPIDVKFMGDLMLIVDFGVFEPGAGLAKPGTGKVWVVSHGKSGIVQLTKPGERGAAGDRHAAREERQGGNGRSQGAERSAGRGRS